MKPKRAIQLISPQEIPMAFEKGSKWKSCSKKGDDHPSNESTMSVATLVSLCAPPKYDPFPDCDLELTAIEDLIDSIKINVRRDHDGISIEGDHVVIGYLLRRLPGKLEIPVTWRNTNQRQLKIELAPLLSCPQNARWLKTKLIEMGTAWINPKHLNRAVASRLGISTEGLRKRLQREANE